MPTPNASGSPGLVRVFALQGGEVSVFCAKGDVHVTGIAPVKGYAETEVRERPDSLRISLTGAEHTSRLWVAWQESCYAEVTESV